MNVSVFGCLCVCDVSSFALLTSAECSLSTSRTMAEGVQEKRTHANERCKDM